MHLCTARALLLSKSSSFACNRIVLHFIGIGDTIDPYSLQHCIACCHHDLCIRVGESIINAFIFRHSIATHIHSNDDQSTCNVNA